MILRFLLSTLLLLGLLSCSLEESTNTTNAQDIEVAVKAIDEEIAGIAKDESCEYINKPLSGTEGKSLNACLRQSDLVMIEEEEVSAEQAKVNRYYYKDNRLVFAAEYIVNPCADTAEVCVNETRCYFQEDQMICEYVRSVSIPLNEEGWLDEDSWEEYLSRVEYENKPLDPDKAPVILERSAQLRNNFPASATNEG